MYSIEGDTVYDPFAGLGTTSLACMAAKRNSVGVEIDGNIASLALKNITVSENVLNAVIDSRIQRHLDFIESLPEDKRGRCYKTFRTGFT